MLSDQSNIQDVYIYEKIEETVADVVMWTEAEAGKTFVGSDYSEKTGGTIFVMSGDVIEEIPITLKMLSGFETSKPGKYRCSLIFNGEVLSDNYELCIRNNWLMRIKEMLVNMAIISDKD